MLVQASNGKSGFIAHVTSWLIGLRNFPAGGEMMALGTLLLSQLFAGFQVVLGVFHYLALLPSDTTHAFLPAC